MAQKAQKVPWYFQKVEPSCGFPGGQEGASTCLEMLGWALLRRAGDPDSSLYCTSQTQTPANSKDATFYLQTITRTHLLLSAATATTLVQAAIIPLLDWSPRLLTGLPLASAVSIKSRMIWSIQSQILSLLRSKPNPSLRSSPCPVGLYPFRHLAPLLHRPQGLCTSSSLPLESAPPHEFVQISPVPSYFSFLLCCLLLPSTSYHPHVTFLAD